MARRAPSLASAQDAGTQHWPRADVVKLLKDGVSEHASVSGPMAEVVFSSTQHLAHEDLDAMARYLASIPVKEDARAEPKRADGAALAHGQLLYDKRCAACHGAAGQGVAGIYPALAGNRAVTLASHNNVVQVIRQGGFMPTTAGNPRPFGMPPFGQMFSDEEIASVATYIRQSWGNSASPVSALDVLRAK